MGQVQGLPLRSFMEFAGHALRGFGCLNRIPLGLGGHWPGGRQRLDHFPVK